MRAYVVLLSAMRSGSTEFARDLGRAYNWTDAGELFNFRPRGVRATKAAPEHFLSELGQRVGTPLFHNHARSPSHLTRLSPLVCPVVLARTTVDARWCSLQHARRTRDWTGRVRHNCSLRSPTWFVHKHMDWYARVRRTFRPRIDLVFEGIVRARSDALRRVASFCNSLAPS